MINVWRFLGAGGGLFFGMILHEYAHARVALAMGDRTPAVYGRVTLDPKAHADPVGTIVIPALFLIPILVGKPLGFIFGYAKPVPVNHRAMKDQKWAPLVVALAGPATNLVLALIGGLALNRVLSGSPAGTPTYAFALAAFSAVNCFLAVINALPIPPLDGSRVLGLFLSPAAAYKIAELGQYFLLFLVALFLVFRGVIPAMVDPVCRIVTLNSPGVPGCIV
jgi:Zn-dependent protease